MAALDRIATGFAALSPANIEADLGLTSEEREQFSPPSRIRTYAFLYKEKARKKLKTNWKLAQACTPAFLAEKFGVPIEEVDGLFSTEYILHTVANRPKKYLQVLEASYRAQREKMEV